MNLNITDLPRLRANPGNREVYLLIQSVQCRVVEFSKGPLVQRTVFQWTHEIARTACENHATIARGGSIEELTFFDEHDVAPCIHTGTVGGVSSVHKRQLFMLLGNSVPRHFGYTSTTDAKIAKHSKLIHGPYVPLLPIPFFMCVLAVINQWFLIALVLALTTLFMVWDLRSFARMCRAILDENATIARLLEEESSDLVLVPDTMLSRWLKLYAGPRNAATGDAYIGWQSAWSNEPHFAAMRSAVALYKQLQHDDKLGHAQRALVEQRADQLLMTVIARVSVHDLPPYDSTYWQLDE